MRAQVTVYFIDGTFPVKYTVDHFVGKKQAEKIFREGFAVAGDRGSIVYHAPYNIKKVEVCPVE